MGKVIAAPVEVKISTGRDVVLVVDGVPVVYIRHKETREAFAGLNPKDGYIKHEYVACGITHTRDSWEHEYVGSCGTTLALEVKELNMLDVMDAIHERYNSNK